MAKTIEHELIAKHLKVSSTEKEALLKKYNVDVKALPKILRKDPAIAHLDLKAGDLAKIERKSKTAGISAYYREVIE